MLTNLLIQIFFVMVDQPRISDSPRDIAKQYEFLIKGMDDQRQRLRTGMYRASGRFVSESLDVGRLDGPLTIFSAFDFDTNKFRFDRTEPIRQGRVSPPGLDKRSSWTMKMRGGRMIRLQDRHISNTDGSFQVRIGSLIPGVENDVKPLDVRGFGFFYWNDLSSFPATPYEKTLEYLEREKPEEVVEEGRGIWKVTKTFPEESRRTLRRVLWFDQNSGFSPIRMELRIRVSSMPADYWPEPNLESETTWVEIAGVWVPKTARVVDMGDAPSIQRYELSFDWEMVNGMIPPETFTLAGLKLTPGYQVVDDTLGREIIVGSIGSDHALVERTVPLPSSTPNRVWRGWTSFLPYVLAGLGVVAIGLVAWFRFRTARRRSSTV